LDGDFHSPPALTGLVMTAALLGFAVAGLLREGDPHRTLRRAMWLTVFASSVAALSPNLWVLLAARAGQGMGVGLMVAGGLAEVPRRLPPGEAGRVTGAMIAGTALGGLLGRAAGYAGLFLTWRGAFAVGGAGVLVVVALSLARLAPQRAGQAPPLRNQSGGRAPLSITLAGLFILFVSVGMFDAIPYRVAGPPFDLPPVVGDLVYLVFLPATLYGLVAGRLVDRLGARRVIVTTAVVEMALLLAGLISSVGALVIAAAAGICGTVGLHVAHSGWASSYGRAAVGRYLAAYYVGGALAAPVTAFAYGRFGWPGVIWSLIAVTAVVLVLALARQDPDRAQREQADARFGPTGAPG